MSFRWSLWLVGKIASHSRQQAFRLRQGAGLIGRPPANCLLFLAISGFPTAVC